MTIPIPRLYELIPYGGMAIREVELKVDSALRVVCAVTIGDL